MTLPRQVIAAALLAVVAAGACSSQDASSKDPTSHAVTPVRALREATVDLSALSSCLDGARESVELASNPAGADRDGLASMALGGGQRLTGCQQSELPRFSSAVAGLRGTVPWDIAHAASLAQADAQQAAFHLQQYLWGLQQVAGAPEGSRPPAGTVGMLSSNDHEFQLSLERMDRRQHQLGLALSRALAGS